MDLQDYCRNVQIELSGWQAKVKEVVRRLDQADTGDKSNVVSQVYDLHIILSRLNSSMIYKPWFPFLCCLIIACFGCYNLSLFLELAYQL